MVTGAAGQLGCDVMRALRARGVQVVGADIADFDLTEKDSVLAFVAKIRPRSIVHCAAYTAVDKAEDDRERAYAVNVLGTRHIAQAASQAGAKLLYVSTDYVFDGQKQGAYDADDPKNPLGVYGSTKYLGELECRGVEGLFIVRLSWVFGKNGGNFVKTMLKLAETKPEISVVCDQVGSPTYTRDAARTICDILSTDRYGAYHVSNEGTCSWSEFAAETMRLAGRNTAIKPIASADYPARVRRPYNSCFSKKELDANGFSRLPHWKDALARFLMEIGEST